MSVVKTNTRKRVYPALDIKKQLHDFKYKRMNTILETASYLLKVRNIPDFCRLFDLAETFLHDIGETTYHSLARRLSLLGLSIMNIQLDKKKDDKTYQNTILQPNTLATLLIRLYKIDGAATVHDSNSSNNKNDFMDYVSKMRKITNLEIKAGRLEVADHWCKACKCIYDSCSKDMLINGRKIDATRLFLKLTSKRDEKKNLRIKLRRKRGDRKEIIKLRRHTYVQTISRRGQQWMEFRTDENPFIVQNITDAVAPYRNDCDINFV